MQIKKIQVAQMIASAALIITGHSSSAQLSLSTISSTGYTVNVEIMPIDIASPNTCVWGYNYNVVVEYSVSFTGNNIPSALYFISGSISCGNQSHFFILPSSGGSGTLTTVSNPYRFQQDCATSTPESLGCGNVQIQLIGLGLPYQTISGVVDFDIPEVIPPIPDVSWNGFVSDSWDEATNWLSGEVPLPGANVTIGAGSNFPTISGSVEVNDIIIESGSGIQFENSSANLVVSGNFVNNGAFSPGSGKVTFEGSADQTISGTETPIFHGLRIATENTVTLETDIALTGALLPNSGTFDWNSHTVTLLSDGENTGSIGEIKDEAEIIGDEIIYHRYFPAASGNWRMMCSPLTDATFEQWNDDIPTTGFPGADYPNYPNAANPWPNIRKYDESVMNGEMSTGFLPISNITEEIENGRGYFTYFIPSGGVIDMEGSFKRGEHVWELSNTQGNGSQGNVGWHLIGNPYPSAIDWANTDGWSKTGITGAVYAFDPAQGQYSSYNNGVSTGQLNGQVASFQAFWVKANGNNATLTINEKAKTSNNGTFFRSTSTDTKTLIRIRLKTDSPTISDEAVIGFHEGSLNEFDPELDALKMFAADANLPNLALVPDSTLNESYSIAMVPIPVEDAIYELLIKPGNKTSFTLENTMVDSFDNDICLVLEDRETQSMHPFNLGDTYAFSKGEMDLSKRFALRVSAPLDVIVMSENCPNANNGTAVVQGFGQAPWTFTWHDEMNNVIRTTEQSTTADVFDELTPGFYHVVVTNESEFCNSSEKTIHIEAAPEFDLTPNVIHPTCNNVADGSIILEIGDQRSWDISLIHLDEGTNYILTDISTDTLLVGLEAGNYELVASNFCANSNRKNALILSDSNAVTSRFETSTAQVSLTEGGLVHFSNASSPNVVSYRWSFGDGVQDSTSMHPSHTYTHWGQFQVELITSNQICSDTSSVVVHVTGVNGGESTSTVNGEPLAALTQDQKQERIRKVEVSFSGEQLTINPDTAIEETVHVTVNTITGQLVMEKSFASLPTGNTAVETSGLKQGLYTFGVRTNTQMLQSGEFTK